MATQRIAVPAVTLQFPSQPSPEPISQIELQMLLSLRGRLHQIAAQLETSEQSIKDRLSHGAVVEEGDHVAELKENFRASVAWKEKAIDLAERLGLNGAAWAQNVLTHTTKTRTVSLVVE